MFRFFNERRDYMQVIGIDIGTTTISIVLIDKAANILKRKKTIAHDAFIQGELPGQRVQDPQKLWKLVQQSIKELTAEFGMPDGIGLTGQMHGMLYVDAQGEAVSPLYTWQDRSGDVVMGDKTTCAQLLKERAGNVATGYGMATHFYLQRLEKIPPHAVKMVTISDYIGMKLCGRADPVIGLDMAASWGCFDLETGDFFRRQLMELGVDLSYLPNLMAHHGCIGKTPGGVPVTVSMGDNQASAAGSAHDLSSTVVLNIGTGGQISFGVNKYLHCKGSVELRPYLNGTYLMTGSSLCGGRAYGMLEQFYREIAGNGTQASHKGNLYEVMERQARDFLKEHGMDEAWKIRTTFAGTRSNPAEKGCIYGISADNFHPGAMTLGMMQGILEELHEMYRQMCDMAGKKAGHLVGSGNGIRKNALMRELAEELFGMDMEIPQYEEEAAYGAALYAVTERDSKYS